MSRTFNMNASQLRKLGKMSVSDLKEAGKLLETATQKTRFLLTYEVNLIYECKLCRNLFRSHLEFISHKTEHCVETCNDFQKKSHNDQENSINYSTEDLRFLNRDQIYPKNLSNSSENNWLIRNEATKTIESNLINLVDISNRNLINLEDNRTGQADYCQRDQFQIVDWKQTEHETLLKSCLSPDGFTESQELMKKLHLPELVKCPFCGEFEEKSKFANHFKKCPGSNEEIKTEVEENYENYENPPLHENVENICSQNQQQSLSEEMSNTSVDNAENEGLMISSISSLSEETWSQLPNSCEPIPGADFSKTNRENVNNQLSIEAETYDIVFNLNYSHDIYVRTSNRSGSPDSISSEINKMRRSPILNGHFDTDSKNKDKFSNDFGGRRKSKSSSRASKRCSSTLNTNNHSPIMTRSKSAASRRGIFPNFFSNCPKKGNSSRTSRRNSLQTFKGSTPKLQVLEDSRIITRSQSRLRNKIDKNVKKNSCRELENGKKSRKSNSRMRRETEGTKKQIHGKAKKII